jgi:hypothetical protein
MYLGVTAVKPLENYTLLLTFTNGEQRYFDVKPYLNFGVFKALQAPSMFNTVRVYAGTITWDDEIDLDPEMLYPKSSSVFL